MGLLEFLSAHPLDEDYEAVARRRAAQPPAAGGAPDGSRRRLLGTPGVVALVVLALLVMTAAIQTRRSAVADARTRAELISQIQSRRGRVDDLQHRSEAMQQEINLFEQKLLTTTSTSGKLEDRIARLGGSAGLVPVSGPGLKVVVDDAPDATSERQQVLDKDLQKLVNGLWEAGAEAISINGQRLTTLSSIRRAAEAITVNYRSLSRPYTVLAIGDPSDMQARFVDTTSGQTWFDLRASLGLKFSMKPQSLLHLPAANIRTLRFVSVDRAHQQEGQG